jgi:hypothetical protein
MILLILILDLENMSIIFRDLRILSYFVPLETKCEVTCVHSYHTNARKVAEARRMDIKLREPPLVPGDEPWDRAFLYDVLDLVLTVCLDVCTFVLYFL